MKCERCNGLGGYGVWQCEDCRGSGQIEGTTKALSDKERGHGMTPERLEEILWLAREHGDRPSWEVDELSAALREAWAQRDAKQDVLQMTIDSCSAEILRLRAQRDAAYARAIEDAAKVAEAYAYCGAIARDIRKLKP